MHAEANANRPDADRVSASLLHTNWVDLCNADYHCTSERGKLHLDLPSRDQVRQKVLEDSVLSSRTHVGPSRNTPLSVVRCHFNWPTRQTAPEALAKSWRSDACNLA